MDDKVEIKDLTQGEPTNTDWLIYQSSSDDEVYKAPKSDVEGEDAYVYIAYADDEDGNGFTNTFSETKDYIAILSTNTEIPSPAASDFSGLWKNYKGAKGDAATATAGTTTTLSAGQSAKVTNVGSTSSAVFKFEIPRGDKGEKGDNGAKIITAEFVGNDLHFNLDDGTEAILVGAKVDLKGIQGNTGASVVDAEVSGDDIVFTKSDGTTITIENILIELKGDTGNGISGIEKTSTVGLVDTYTITYDDETTKTFDVTNGAKGDTGDNATVDAGATTTGEAGTEASVVNSGTTSDAIFDFTIPKGDKGDTGNGIASIAKTGTSGLTDTYTITFTDETTTTFDVVNGEKGDNAYIYIAYASDDSGADFTTTFSSALDYVAILATYTEIETPEASDFAGLWKKYKGEKGDTGERGLNWINEEYSGATTYNVDDALLYNGSSYRCILESTGNLPTNTTYWSIIAQKGTDGEGSGDMLASDYDPTNVADDAFDMDNMVEGTNNKLVSSAEKTAWNDKLDDITGESIADLSDVDTIVGITDGKVLKWSTNKFVVADDNDTTYTASDFDIKDLTDSTSLRTTWNAKEDASNKSTDVTTDGASDVKYPSVKATKTYADGKVEDSITDGHTTIAPSGNAVYDALAGKEDTTNKVTAFQATPDDTHYPSEKLVKESLDAKANANNVLALDNTTAFTPDNDYEPATKKYVDSETKTLTNTRITPRITTITSHATPTINTDNCDAVTITAQAEDITSMTTNLSGTPTNFQKLIIRIKDNGAARAITWGDSFEAKGVALPNTTVISKVLTVGFIYDTVTSKWGCVASSQEA